VITPSELLQRWFESYISLSTDPFERYWASRPGIFDLRRKADKQAMKFLSESNGTRHPGPIIEATHEDVMDLFQRAIAAAEAEEQEAAS